MKLGGLYALCCAVALMSTGCYSTCCHDKYGDLIDTINYHEPVLDCLYHPEWCLLCAEEENAGCSYRYHHGGDICISYQRAQVVGAEEFGLSETSADEANEASADALGDASVD
jgi:hypothetical protein